MNIGIAAIILVSGAALFLFLRSRIAPNFKVTAQQLPQVVSALAKTGANSSFAVFNFTPSEDDRTVNLQYSIENNRVGLDWVLLAPRNIQDKDAMISFIQAKGFSVAETEMNEVRYLRVEDDGITDLGAKIITEFYKIPPHLPLGLIVEKFEWPA